MPSATIHNFRQHLMASASWPPMIHAELRVLQRQFDNEAQRNKDLLLSMKERLGV